MALLPKSADRRFGGDGQGCVALGADAAAGRRLEGRTWLRSCKMENYGRNFLRSRPEHPTRRALEAIRKCRSLQSRGQNSGLAGTPRAGRPWQETKRSLPAVAATMRFLKLADTYAY